MRHWSANRAMVSRMKTRGTISSSSSLPWKLVSRFTKWNVNGRKLAAVSGPNSIRRPTRAVEFLADFSSMYLQRRFLLEASCCYPLFEWYQSSSYHNLWPQLTNHRLKYDRKCLAVSIVFGHKRMCIVQSRNSFFAAVCFILDVVLLTFLLFPKPIEVVLFEQARTREIFALSICVIHPKIT